MTTVFKNRIVKGITTYALALCIFANTGFAGMIAYQKGIQLNARVINDQLKNDHKSAALVKPTAQASGKAVENGVNGASNVNVAQNNVVNNTVKNTVNDRRPVNTNAAAKPKTSQPAIPIPWDQYQILVRIINSEAGGEPFEGQVAVAAVLLNRIRSGRFPSTISANVFRSGEFESVSNGYIWETNPSPSSYKAALLALKGWDPTAGSLYFYNPAKSTSRWIWSRPIYTIIGKHYFAG